MSCYERSSNFITGSSRNCSTNCDSQCVPDNKYLEIAKYLSEFSEEYQKKRARENLGIPEILESLKQEITTEVNNQLEDKLTEFYASITSTINNFSEKLESFTTELNTIKTNLDIANTNIQNLDDRMTKLEGDYNTFKSDVLGYISNWDGDLASKLDKKIDKEILAGKDAVTQIKYINTEFPDITDLRGAVDQALEKFENTLTYDEL